MENCLSIFVLSILDYGDCLYDSCSEIDKAKLDDVLLSAARVVTGAKRGTSHRLLYNGVGWESLRKRRHVHKLCKFYAIVNGYTPEYLRGVLPRSLNASVHNTRGSTTRAFALYICKTECFRKSFFPSTTVLYNNLTPNERNCNTLKIFSRIMKQSLKIHVPCFYYEGARKLNIVLSQMRMQFCSLNYDLYRKGCIDSEMCNCREAAETLDHYFFHCSYYTVERRELVESISNFGLEFQLNTQLLTFGKEELETETNRFILNCVMKYIDDTGRFQ